MKESDAMIDPKRCPECGAALSTTALAGLCPACLLKQGAADSATQAGVQAFVPPAPSELARLFPQLEVLELIGRGGMGAVYRARQPGLERLVALKLLPARTLEGPAFAERFNREARALARLSHPNIVAVYDHGQVEGWHYLLMEYVDGVNLRQLERTRRLSPREALQLIPPICDALQYAHDEGVVHRDIKPENVLIDRKGRVKIADFGLARLVGAEPAESRLTGEHQVLGTPHYMAPEQVEHPQEVDHRADIYSLGVVFYELLTGELPLGRFPAPSRKVQVDVRLDEVVLRALEKEPERRYQQANQVKTEVENIAADRQPEQAEPAPRGRRRWLVPALALVLLTCVGTFMWVRQSAIQGMPPQAPRLVESNVVSVPSAPPAYTQRQHNNLTITQLPPAYQWYRTNGVTYRQQGTNEVVAEAATGSTARAWESTEPYAPPGFDRFFPDDPEGGRRLDALWLADNKDQRPDQEIFSLVRGGLRCASANRSYILRWLGNKYIWGRSPQNPDAIEIMYHAADFSGAKQDPYGTRHFAVYFGLSVTQPKTPAILRTLAELCMAVDDPNDLERVAWGARAQMSELLPFLKPFLESTDPAVREKAGIVEQILRGELKAFAWAEEKARERAKRLFTDRLPGLKQTLAHGTSVERLEAMEFAAKEAVTLIMDESFVEAYAQCAQDPDARVRNQVARQAGQRWIWTAKEQSVEAIDLMLRLSRDAERRVRSDAVYFGLSTVREKSDTVVRRLLDMAMADREPNLYGRIAWGLRGDKPAVIRLLTAYLNDADPKLAADARAIYRDMTQETPPPPGQRAEAPKPPADPEALRLAELNSGEWRRAFAIGNELAKLPPEEGWAWVKERWGAITPVDGRQQLLKAFTFARHPRLVPMLELAVLDSAPPVQTWGLEYLKSVALEDFTSDYAKAKAWLAAHRELELGMAVQQAVEAATESLRRGAPSELTNRLAILGEHGELAGALVKASATSNFWTEIEAQTAVKDTRTVELALKVAAQMKAGEDWCRRVVVPRLATSEPPPVQRAAARALGRAGWSWAVEPLLGTLTNALESATNDRRSVIWSAATALGEIGSATAVPPMIGVIAADNTYDTVYGVGYFGLNPLTGVKYDEAHKGAWWRQWWEQNRERYPAEVRSLPIPQYRTNR